MPKQCIVQQETIAAMRHYPFAMHYPSIAAILGTGPMPRHLPQRQPDQYRRRPRCRIAGTVHWCLAVALKIYLLGAAGCASQVPLAIRGDGSDATSKPVSVPQVQHNPDAYSGQRVRWGGSILALRNLPESTEIEVLSRALARDGEPRVEADAEGRFIARLPGFLDPTQYPKDRLLTVVGVLAGVDVRDVGDYPYRYPVVAVSSHYLWPKVEPRVFPYGSPWAYGSAWPYGYPGYYGPYGYGSWYGPGFGPWYGPGFGPGYPGW